jgi:cardiolipin synthase
MKNKTIIFPLLFIFVMILIFIVYLVFFAYDTPNNIPSLNKEVILASHDYLPADLRTNARLLIDGKETFAAIFNHIQEAKNTILIHSFIWRDDKVGNMLAKQLLEAADRGVQIIIEKDKLGALHEKTEENKLSFFHKKAIPSLWIKQFFLEKLYAHPGKFGQKPEISYAGKLSAHPNITVSANQIKNDHSKYFIFDNKTLVLGSVNIEDKEVFFDAAGREYSDYMIELDGRNFVKQFLQELNGEHVTSNSEVEFVVNKFKPVRQFEVKSKILSLLRTAQNSVIIQNSYWGDKDVLQRLAETANRGVHVQIFLPQTANLQTDLNLKSMRWLLEHSAYKPQIYLHKKMLHAKLILVDNNYLLLGSSNLNSVSLEKMQETNVLIDLPGSAILPKLQKNLTKHRQQSQLIRKAEQLQYNSFLAFFENIFS